MDEIRPFLEKLERADVNALKREGKDFDFTDVHHLMVEIFNNLKLLGNNPEFWKLLPQKECSEVSNAISQFLQLVEKIEKFKPNEGNPQGERDGIANSIRELYGRLYEHLFWFLEVYVMRRGFNDGRFQQFSQEAAEHITSMKQQQEQGQKILDAMKEASATTGASKFAGIFEAQAELHRRSANIWLAVTAVVASGIVWFLWDSFHQLTATLQNGDVNLPLSIQIFLAKVLLLSFFSIVFYQIAKNYNAQMHLQVLNKHRENSLKTFQAFLEATNDPKVKDAVLIQATKAIFNAGHTGYISHKEGIITEMETVKIMDQFKEK